MRLICPKILEPLRAQLRVAYGVMDILVPQVVLDRPGIMPVIGQLETGGMPQHVRMHRKANLGDLRGPRQHLAKARFIGPLL